MEVESKTLVMNHHPLRTIVSFLPSLKPSSSATSSSVIVHLLRRFLLLSLRLLLSILPSSHSASSSSAAAAAAAAGPAGSSLSSSSSPASRALSHVLSVVSRVPVASRKYDLVRSLADRLLDDNLRFSSSDLNRDALSEAFSQTLHRLELAVRPPPAEGAVGGMIRRWVGEVVTGGRGEFTDDEAEKVAAEKMAAEVVWMAGKMADCGAVDEAVRRWGEAAGLGAVALTAEPRIQVSFVRVSAFLFRHANAKQFGRKGAEEEECDVSCYRMAMLTSWLPLLCRASNGTDAPVLSSGERAEMVKVLEEMIEKLGWHQQEEVLALWLHHFTSCPDSDWPNLESCYTRWYSKTRDLFLK